MRLICLLPVLTVAAITCRDSAPPVPHTRRGPVTRQESLLVRRIDSITAAVRDSFAAQRAREAGARWGGRRPDYVGTIVGLGRDDYEVSVLLEFVPNDSAPQVGSPRVRFALRRGSAVLGQDHRAVNVDSLRVGDVCLVWTFPRELHYDRPIEPVTIDVVSIVRLNARMPRPRGSRPAA